MRIEVVALGSYLGIYTTVNRGRSLSILLNEFERWTIELIAALGREHHLARRATPPALRLVVGIDTHICLDGGRITAVHLLHNQIHTLRIGVVAELNHVVASARNVAVNGIGMPTVAHRHVNIMIILAIYILGLRGNTHRLTPPEHIARLVLCSTVDIGISLRLRKVERLTTHQVAHLPEVLHVAVAILCQEVTAYLLDVLHILRVDDEACLTQTSEESATQQERHLPEHPRNTGVAVADDLALTVDIIRAVDDVRSS